jgi:DNA invertase Pin-like site-specific DNA recombinase
MRKAKRPENGRERRIVANITYTLTGDYRLPDIALSNPPDAPPLGRYGMLHKAYLRKLKPGDLLVIKSIDRLGRSYEDIIEHWRSITKVVGADIEVLDMPVLNTRERDGDITWRVISDIVLELLSFVAQKEREFIRQRQSEGIASAKRRGVKFGRPPMKPSKDFAAVASAYRARTLNADLAAERPRVSRNTFLAWSRSG